MKSSPNPWLKNDTLNRYDLSTSLICLLHEHSSITASSNVQVNEWLHGEKDGHWLSVCLSANAGATDHGWRQCALWCWCVFLREQGRNSPVIIWLIERVRRREKKKKTRERERKERRERESGCAAASLNPTLNSLSYTDLIPIMGGKRGEVWGTSCASDVVSRYRKGGYAMKVSWWSSQGKQAS